MSKKKTAEEEISYRQEVYNIAITITHLNKMIGKHKENPIDNFLQKEIIRLRERKKKLLENGKD